MFIVKFICRIKIFKVWVYLWFICLSMLLLWLVKIKISYY